jgi:DnaJ family protein C protein 19
MKFLWLLFLAVLAWRLFVGRWPWQEGARALRRRALEHARALLGVQPGASRREIIEAHRRLVAMVHPDRGGRNEDVHEANAARDILLGELPNHLQEQE